MLGVALLLVLAIVAFVGLILPPLAEQVAHLVQNFDGFRDRVLVRLPPHYPILKTIVAQIFALPASPEVAVHLHRPLVWGRVAVSGLATTFFVLVLTLYLLLDGKQVYAWLLAYVPRRSREKMATTVQEMSTVVYAYVRGQIVTSVIFTVFTGVVLSLFHVPAALPLAILAGICDVIPVVGIIIATAPAVLLALAVSPLAAACVLGLYVVYHVFESYFVVPRVYGNQLRLSTLAVLLALLIGGTLQGIMGAVLVLPLVAAYPIVERIWLSKYLRPEVLRDHTALAEAAHSDDSDQAVNAVLLGEKHPAEQQTGRIPAEHPSPKESG